MQMVMQPLPDHAVEFVCTILREEPRDEVALLNPATQRDDRFIVMCGWCKKVQTSEWVEVEEAIIRLHLLINHVSLTLLMGFVLDVNTLLSQCY